MSSVDGGSVCIELSHGCKEDWTLLSSRPHVEMSPLWLRSRTEAVEPKVLRRCVSLQVKHPFSSVLLSWPPADVQVWRHPRQRRSHWPPSRTSGSSQVNYSILQLNVQISLIVMRRIATESTKHSLSPRKEALSFLQQHWAIGHNLSRQLQSRWC